MTDPDTPRDSLLRVADLDARELDALLDLAAAMKRHPLAWRGRARRAAGRVLLRQAVDAHARVVRGGDQPARRAADHAAARRAAARARRADRRHRARARRPTATAIVDPHVRAARRRASWPTHASVPVINALTDDHHPARRSPTCLTLRERFGTLEGLPRGLRRRRQQRRALADGGGARWPAWRSSSPRRPAASPTRTIVAAQRTGRRHGGRVQVTDDPRDAVRGAPRRLHRRLGVDGRGRRARERAARRSRPTASTRALMAGARAATPIFLHCLPAHRGEEVDADVIDGPAVAWCSTRRPTGCPTEQALLHALVTGDWEDEPMRVVVALGGNALLRRGEPADAEAQRRQRRAPPSTRSPRSRASTTSSSPTATARRSGCSRSRPRPTRRSTPYPLDVLGAETEGMIGYLLEQELRQRAAGPRRSRRCSRRSSSTPTTRRSAHPTKPIGPVYDDEHGRAARRRARLDGGARRRAAGAASSPSPEPLAIVELATIRLLRRRRACSWSAPAAAACPSSSTATGRLRGVEAVVDKDLAAALLAEELGADALLLLTDVAGRRDATGARRQARALATSTPAELRAPRLRRRLDGSEGRRGLPLRRGDRRHRRHRRARGRRGDPARRGGHASSPPPRVGSLDERDASPAAAKLAG